MKRYILMVLSLFAAVALQAKHSRVRRVDKCDIIASAGDPANAATAGGNQNSASGSASDSDIFPPSLPHISNATVSPVPTAEDYIDKAEEDATVPLDETFIAGDAPDKSGNLIPLEPGGGEGLLEPYLNASSKEHKPCRITPDISGADSPLVEKYREYYLSPERIKWLSSALENGEQYRLYVRAKLIERGMPAYLEYLPVVESSYKTNARSKAGALGLWQFMTNSTKGFLKRDDFVDERLDPWKSTDAALSKLMVNFKQFGDWPLALAAYNCGAGAMQGILRKNPGKDFWALAAEGKLRKETAQYVPRLVAIADICENTEHYGIDIPTARRENGESTNPRAGFFDYADTNKAVSLKRLASALKIDEKMLISMNPALYREITPPHSYTIRVPEGMGEATAYALKEAPAYQFQTRYTVVAGDSLWKISRAFRVTVSAICDANSINEKSTLKVGKVLYIPNGGL